MAGLTSEVGVRSDEELIAERGDELHQRRVLSGGALHQGVLLPQLPILADQPDPGKALPLRHDKVHHHPRPHTRQVPARLTNIHQN
jgi:hypothetical protein